MKKTCNKCGIQKSISNFGKNKNGKYGVHSICKICKNEYKKQYREINGEKIKLQGKTYSTENREKIKIRKQNYYQKNKTLINKKKLNYNKSHKHIICWRNLLRIVLKKLNKSKESHTIDLLGYSAIQLKEYIQSQFTDGMSWDNHGEWHIDHIKPISTFSLDTPPSVVNALNNLRPLWATTREINGVIYEGNLNRKKYFRK